MLIRKFVQALALASCVGVAWASTEGQIGTPQEPEPDIVGAGGEFTNRYDIAIPEFRGLPLPVSLSYNSSRTSRGGIDNTVGFGWKLNAFSMIERKSLGGGVPTFDDGQDLYVLDGQELMACDKLDGEVAASNPLGGYYPLRYLTDRDSASCLAGGNMSTRVEGNRKIVFDKVANEFTVTKKDGTKYIYKSLGVLAGYTGTDSQELKVAQKTRWLLDRIEDAQPTPNVVQYTYNFSPKGYAFAPRLSKINYGNGYLVLFQYRNYANQGVMVPKYATGTSVIGWQHFQLRSIRIYDGAKKIRAYQIFHQDSALSKAQLVTKIAAYGNDFQITGHDISGGSVLDQEKYSYSADTVAFSEANEANTSGLVGTEFHESVNTIDSDRDGIDELLFGGPTLTRHWSNGDDDAYIDYHTFQAGLFEFTRDRALTTKPMLPQRCIELAPGKGHELNHDLGPVRVLGTDRSSGSLFCLRDWIKQNDNSSGETTDFKMSIMSLAESGSSPVSETAEIHYAHQTQPTRERLIGNFDLDPMSEVWLGRKAYQISPDAVITGPSSALSSGVDGVANFTTDFTGDGVDDFVAGKYLHKVLPERGYLGGNFQSKVPSTKWINLGSPFPASEYTRSYSRSGEFLGYGDVNGDGLTDLIFHEHNNSGHDKIGYYLSTGSGFLPRKVMSLGVNLISSLRNDPRSIRPRVVGHRSTVRDINGDGLADLIIHDGFKQRLAGSNSAPYLSQRTWVFLNNGASYSVAEMYGGYNGFIGLVAVGDFDGNGRVDFVREGANVSKGRTTRATTTYHNKPGKILFGDGALPNRMVRVVNASGGVTDIEYTSSADFGVNQAPGVQLVVKSLTRHDGLGNSSKTSYSYVGGAYDFVNRRTLGYRTVTAHLPAIAGEASGPQVVTTYMNDHLAEYGKVKSRLVIEGSTITHQRDIYDYRYNFDQANPGNGPYRVELSQSRKAVRYGDELVERTKQFWYDDYGRKITQRDLGFTVNGADLDGSDNTQYEWSYAQNLDGYVMNVPGRERLLNAFVDPTDSDAGKDRKFWIWAKFTRYDNLTGYSNSVPTSGNATEIIVWDGVSYWPIQGPIQTFTYDAHGNVLTETDGRGAVTQHSYDAQKHLFRTSTTNALSEVASTTWSTTCQAPLTQTDINGRVTQFSYDQHCREQRVDQPNGNYVATNYVAFGDPSAQHVVQTTKSGSTVAGSELSKTYSYFDGLGREYMALAPGGQTAITQASKVLKAYDARGNLSWQSIPLPYTAQTATGQERLVMAYDAMNRQTSVTHPDGAIAETRYAVSSFAHEGGPVLAYPTVKMLNEDCADGIAATVCIEVDESFDAKGARIRQTFFDRASSDVDAGATAERVTRYSYTLDGHLSRVEDPAGAVYEYMYDSVGNRVRSDDPGLGIWTMEYDLNRNLIRQTDAKGQIIDFTYDALNRVTRKRVTAADGSLDDTDMVYGTVNAGYYNIGELTAQSNADHTITFDYDLNGQVARERHTVNSRTFEMKTTYTAAGQVKDMYLPLTGSSNAWVGTHQYDGAGRLKSIVRASDGRVLLQSVNYDLAGRPVETVYGNGARDATSYNEQRGWIDRIESFEGISSSEGGVNPKVLDTIYTRSASGRVASQYNEYASGQLAYSYDYAGRLLTASNSAGLQEYSQSFQYDSAGRMRYNSRVGTYVYSTSAPDHAPSSLTRFDGRGNSLSYDSNGNMLAGLNGKTMTYDAENRPLSVSEVSGGLTTYTYGADGSRLKKTEDGDVTLYIGSIEIRKFGQANTEQLISYPTGSIKLVDGALSVLHMDQLSSVRGVSGADGAIDERVTYRPFGEPTERDHDASASNDSKRFIGERYDADAGLMYLNARYYDPELASYIPQDAKAQPQNLNVQ